MAARDMMLSGVRGGTVCSSMVELDKEKILTHFDPDALFLDNVSSGMVDAQLSKSLGGMPIKEEDFVSLNQLEIKFQLY